MALELDQFSGREDLGARRPAVGHEERGLVTVAAALLVEFTSRFPERVRKT